MTLRTLLVAWLSISAAACGGGGEPGGTATVTFVYQAATTLDPAVAAQFPACVGEVGATHLHPSWLGFELVSMTAEGNQWVATFDDVPVGGRLRIRVSDPNACASSPTGAATQGVLANGVLLTDVVGTPGIGTEPGLAFTLAAGGAVTP
ncbi:MAG: hypothetical protein IPO09_06785 [Anaeromyxobacter sp.]|nr:hypothetical protein [Anaeromyxobacter sp.]MBL0277554.1 hypothetical protein [Anaeromyxobacter sp.]